jgi:hypothetical protein
MGFKTTKSLRNKEKNSTGRIGGCEPMNSICKQKNGWQICGAQNPAEILIKPAIRNDGIE